jgi:hypothetical protein
MRLVVPGIVLIVLGLAGGLAYYGERSSFAHGELRCEGAGALIIKVDGMDYAVNGMPGPSYPPIQRIWNSSIYPDLDIGRIIDRGLTLCNW